MPAPWRRALLGLPLLLLLAPGPAGAASPRGLVVAKVAIIDQKAVFATVESVNVEPARARIAGTVAQLSVRAGDHVVRGQVVAVVADEKLTLGIQALDAEITGLKSQLAQARIDLSRAQKLARQGAAPLAQLDRARTAVQVATSALAARESARSVAEQRLKDGEVHAPITGRVLAVPVTPGTVVLDGEMVANIAEHNYVLRLSIPEREGRFLAKGDTVRVDPADLGQGAREFGRITLIYPQIRGGQVIADAAVGGLGNYFVGQRVRVWIPADRRAGFVIPADFILTRFGLDYVRLRLASGAVVDSPIQRGAAQPTPQMPKGIEILAGLQVGDVLVKP